MNNSMAAIPQVLIKYLQTRGIEGDTATNNFLFPNLAHLPKPDGMKNLVEAASLVAEYISNEKQIIIWGDYDVDGTTGTALLVNFFREFKTDVNWHIPNRLKEGYGLNIEWFMEQRKKRLAKDFLLITVDCGSSNCVEIEAIKRMGGMVIVTDHHSLTEDKIPDCLVLNPSQSTCGFCADQLAGVGVAFYLAAGIRANLANHSRLGPIASKLNLKQFLGFVALGTIADVVNLTPTNRLLVRAGFEALANTRFPGLRQLLVSCDITGAHISSEDIGFLIGPRINAAGRLGKSGAVVELLTEHNSKKAALLAQKLTKYNIERKAISDDNLEIALSMITSTVVEEKRCILIEGRFHKGVAGIVASRLVDSFKVPAIVFARKELSDGNDLLIGSARSVAGVNIVELLSQCSGLLVKYGGHEMAAGLTISLEYYDIFTNQLSALIKKEMDERSIEKKNKFDISNPVDVTMSADFIKYLRLLEPFGPGNPQPIFQDNAVLITDSRAVGRDSEHLQVTIRGKYSNLKGIGFRLGESLSDVQRNPKRKMIYTPTVNRYRGTENWQVRVIDL